MLRYLFSLKLEGWRSYQFSILPEGLPMRTLSELSSWPQNQLWPGLPLNLIQANSQTISRIGLLRSQCMVDIEHWDIMEMFRWPMNEPDPFGLPPQSRIHLLIQDYNRINQIFFERLEKERGDIIALTETSIAQFESYLAQIKELNKQNNECRLIQRIDEQARYIQANFNDIQYALQEIRNLWTVNHEYDLFSELLKVINEVPFFRFDSVYKNQIIFQTRSNIVLTEKNPKAGIDIQVDFGKFEVKYHPLDHYIQIRPANGVPGLNVNEFYHPHVSKEGQVCFGEATSAYIEAMKIGDLRKVFELIQNVLMTYTPESPYLTLLSFKRAEDKRRELRVSAEERIALNDWQIAQQMAYIPIPSYYTTTPIAEAPQPPNPPDQPSE